MAKPSWIEQNPVDFYNQNHKKDAVDILLRKNKRLTVKGSKIMIATESGGVEVFMSQTNGIYKVESENNMGLIEGQSYSPFQLLCKFHFNNNFKAAFLHVGINYMDMNFPYVRIGTKYFKVTTKTDRFGIARESLLIWNKDEIKQDYGKEMLQRVTTYDDFIIHPDNKNYQKVVKGFYNLYAPFPHKPKEFDLDDLSKIQWSLKLMKHIFQKQVDLGLKYVKVCYEKPQQALPILTLTSEERSTGKSTFVDWFTIIFGANMVIINPQDIGSSFNDSYATKNIIAIEESRFDSVQATEKLKALATQKTILVNTKFVAPYNTPFYGKLIITSNDETKFSKVDDAEIRYWVLKIPSLVGKANHNILDELTKEIPYFLYYLQNLPDIDYTKSRQVFTPEEIETDALKVVKSESKESLQKDLEILLDDFCSNNEGIKELHFIPIDIKNLWFKNDSRISVNYISRVMRDKMKLERVDKRGRYTPHLGVEESKIGLYFKYKNQYFNKEKSADGLFDEDLPTPF